VYRADPRPLSSVTGDQLVVDEKVTRLFVEISGCTALSILKPARLSPVARVHRRTRRRGGFSTSYTDASDPTTCWSR